MTKEQFWKSVCEGEYKDYGKIRLWWEKLWFDWWWKNPVNRKFIEEIPNEDN